MKFKNIFLLSALVFSAHAMSGQEVRTWEIDNAHSSVNFSVNHLFSAVTGKFQKFSGDLKFNPENLGKSSATFTVQVNSIDTDEPDRDKHLLSDDFFDAENHPEILFKSTGFEKRGKKSFIVKGKLTMRGNTREVELPLEVKGVMDSPWVEGKEIMGVSIKTTLNRTDYDVGTGSWAATATVGDEVRIEVHLELQADK